MRFFLGYNVSTFTSTCSGRKRNVVGPDGKVWRVVRRPSTGNVSLRVPKKKVSAFCKQKVSAFCKQKGYGVLARQKGRPRLQFLDSSDVEIVAAFNSEFRGFANYYALADDVKKALGVLGLVVFRSLSKTLGMRHKASSRLMKNSLRKNGEYVVTYKVGKETRTLKVWKLKHLECRSWQQSFIDKVQEGARFAHRRNDLITRLKTRRCETCGNDSGPLEMHHIRRLKDMEKELPAIWELAAQRRKTIALCRRCHKLAHKGR